MNRIFQRFVVLVMLAITLATFVIYFTFSRLFGDPLEQIATRQAAGQIFLLEQYIDLAASDEWLARLNKVREVSGADMELLPLPAALGALPERRRAELLRGAIVLDVAGKAFYRRVDLTGARYIDSDAEVIHVQRLPIDIGEALGMEAIRFAIVALFLLVPIGWWSRSHWRGLQALSRVADDFGRGDLAARPARRQTSSIAPLAGRIGDMAERIATLLETRKNLLHAVSHELRTPIARLEFGLELLRAAADDPALEPRLLALEGDVDELKALVNELLSLNKLDHAEAPRGAPFDLAAMLRACADGCAAGLRGKTLEAHIGAADGLADGDQRLLARAVNNVLGNAAKYAAGRVVLTAARRDAGHWTVVVRDDGPGIPADMRGRVFEPFYRLGRDADHAAGGYGLGLAIAQRALQLHGGAIAIEDAGDGMDGADGATPRGARLVLTIPCRRG